MVARPGTPRWPGQELHGGPGRNSTVARAGTLRWPGQELHGGPARNSTVARAGTPRWPGQELETIENLRPLVASAAFASLPLLPLPSLCASLCVFAGVCTMMVCGYLVKKSTGGHVFSIPRNATTANDQGADAAPKVVGGE